MFFSFLFNGYKLFLLNPSVLIENIKENGYYLNVIKEIKG